MVLRCRRWTPSRCGCTLKRFRRLLRSVAERRHDLAAEAARSLARPSAAPRPAAVDQDVADPDVAQLPEYFRDVVGSAVHGTVLVDGPGIAGGPVRAAEDCAVGPGGELQLAGPILQPALQGPLSFLGGGGDGKGAGG